jgi:hypothetical protein
VALNTASRSAFALLLGLSGCPSPSAPVTQVHAESDPRATDSALNSSSPDCPAWSASRVGESPTQPEVQALLDAYVAAHRACTIVVRLHETDPTRGLNPWCGGGEQRCDGRLEFYFLTQPRKSQFPKPLTFLFGFTEGLSNPTSVADVQAKYGYTDYDLPLPGLSAPGWEVFASPPTSPVHRNGESGLRFDGYAAPQLRGRLLTTIDAVMAYRDVPSCAPPADAPVRPECMANSSLRSPVRIEFDLAIRTTSLD